MLPSPPLLRRTVSLLPVLVLVCRWNQCVWRDGVGKEEGMVGREEGASSTMTIAIVRQKAKSKKNQNHTGTNTCMRQPSK